MLIREKLVINTAELGNKLPQLISLFRYENPEYYTKKSMKVSVKGIEPTLYHYALEDGPNGKQLILPRGAINKVKKFYNDNNIPFRILDKRIEHPTLIDWKMRSHSVEKGDPIIFGKHQEDIINTLIKHEGGLIQASPGSGKTYAMLGLIEQIKQPTLIIMHEHRLRSQWEAEIKDKVEGNFKLGRLDGDKKIDGDVVVGLFQTATKVMEEDPEWFNQFGMVITDECLDPGTIISTPSGLKLLEELQIGDEVLTPTGIARIKNKWETEKEAYKYTITSGNYIIASENHIIPTYKGWKAGYTRGICNKEISKCRGLLFPRELPQFIKEKKSNINYLFGWFLGDGTLDRTLMKFAFRKQRKIDLFRKEFETLGWTRDFTNKRGDTVFSIESNISKILIKEFNLLPGKKSIDFALPDSIYKNVDIDFLRGIFQSDGNLQLLNGKGNQSKIELDLTMKIVIYQIAAMLKRLGVYCTVLDIERKNKRHSSIYRINIFGENVLKLNEILNIYDQQELKDKIHLKKVKSPYWANTFKSIEPLGKQKLIDIELDDENKIFIANGFLVHNCHHASAETYNKLLTNIPAKYRVGITGTVKRSDGLELLIYDMLGPILIDITEKKVKERITKFEPLTQHTDIEFRLPTRRTYQNGVSDVAYDHTKTLNLICADEKRNTLILKNILKDIEEGYFPLVLSDRKEHCREIYNALTDMGIHSILLISDTRKSVKWEEVKSDTSVKCIVAIGKIASEGLDLPRLSSIHLTCPTTNESQIRQKIARVRRSFPDKPLPRVWDYVDNLAYYWRRNKDGEKVQSFKLKEQGVSRKRFYKKILDEYAEA